MTQKKKNVVEDWEDLEDEVAEVKNDSIFEKTVKLFEDSFTDDDDEIDSLLSEYGY